MKKLAIVSLVLAFAVGCSKSDEKKADKPPATKPPEQKPPEDKKPDKVDVGDYVAFAAADLQWAPMDPNQKEGPQIAVVKGNPQEGAADLFLKVPAGGSPGIHTHTAGYHAVVVSGTPTHWLPGDKDIKPLEVGSYWYQPGGQPHGDKCEGDQECVIFVMIEGKFDMAPSKEKKVKDRGDYKLIMAKDMKFGPFDPNNAEGPQMSVVNGDPKAGPVAILAEFPEGHKPPIHTHSADYHGAILSGTANHWVDGAGGDDKEYGAGSYWFQPGKQMHGDNCPTGPCKAFVYFDGPIDFTPKQ